MKLRVALLLNFLAIVPAFAGEEPTSIRKFDEFGAVGHCDLTARLDNFAIQLQHDSETTGHIVVYGPEGEGLGTGKLFLKLMKDYLVDARGLPKRRVNTIYSGRNQVLYEPKIELWITPPGAAAPEPTRFETNIDTFKGKFITEEAHDFVDVLWEDEGEMGPGIGLTTDATIADMLQQQKKAIVYIVTYNGEDAVPGSSRRMAARKLEAFKEHKIDVSRVKTIFGGVRKKTEIELWVAAPGDPPPVKEAGPEPPPLKNAEIALHDDGTMGNPKNERAVFNRMLEVLREQPALKVVVIVELQTKEPEPEPEAESTPVAIASPEQQQSEPITVEEDDDPPADL
ncbi:MAG TPA: hypothetical protein VFB65_14500, partial [Pyrinomonadaceae bacterium]|nr:hypothetical protein [Pyrinomonadaceae bacterium]